VKTSEDLDVLAGNGMSSLELQNVVDSGHIYCKSGWSRASL